MCQPFLSTPFTKWQASEFCRDWLSSQHAASKQLLIDGAVYGSHNLKQAEAVSSAKEIAFRCSHACTEIP